MRTWTSQIFQNWLCGLILTSLLVPSAMAGNQTEKVRNDKVLVVEQTLAPGEMLSLPGDHPGVVVYLDAGSVEIAPAQGKSRTESVKRGETVFQAATIRDRKERRLRCFAGRLDRISRPGRFGDVGYQWAGAELQSHLRKPIRPGL